MTDADSPRDDRDGAILPTKPMQCLSTAWDNDVYILMQFEQFTDITAIGAFDILNHIGRQARINQCLTHDFYKHHVTAQGLFAPAQNGSVPRLDGQRCHIHRDIGTRFIDHPKDPYGDAHARDVQSVF